MGEIVRLDSCRHSVSLSWYRSTTLVGILLLCRCMSPTGETSDSVGTSASWCGQDAQGFSSIRGPSSGRRQHLQRPG